MRRGVADGSPLDYAYYDDFTAVIADTPSDVTTYPPDLHRITATDDALISTWHSDDHFTVHALASGALLGEVTLEGYDGWRSSRTSS